MSNMDGGAQNTIDLKDAENAKRQISIWLDEYDDIFSDFDPRPYSERILSDDFISELKKVCREDVYEIGELHLLIPQNKHNETDEHIIVKRLHSYFKNGKIYLSSRARKTRRQAILIALSGLILILLASYISATQSNKFYLKALLVLFEPAGWFFAWTGLDDLFFASRRKRTELDFFSKMAKAKIVFTVF